VFWVVRKGLSLADDGRQEQLLGVWETLEQAREDDRENLKRCSRGAGASSGYPALISYTNK
jgi:hypothetical protein